MTRIIILLLMTSLTGYAQEQDQREGGRKGIFQPVTLTELDGMSQASPGTVYWITDPGKEGAFVYAGTARNQDSDNGATVVVTEGLQVYKRIYNGFIDARWFGVVGNATLPSNGIVARGTDNTPFLQKAINAAADGETVMVPAGKYLFAKPLDTIKGAKRISLLFLGDTYHNGSDFIIITNEGGPYEQHTVRHEGTASGRINMPRHTKQTHDNGSSPEWKAFTGAFVKIYNAFQQKVELNRVDGFRTPVELIGGGGKGSQENNIWIRSAYKNANGIVLTSLDGQSYIDKNEFWVSRLSGGLGIKIDGYSGKAKNGETFNGAARSNKFHIMIEQVDSIAECHGDITEPLFDITVEGGDHTGVFGNIGFRMRSEAPNFVRSPKYTGQGIFEWRIVQHGMGIGGTINVPVWNSSKGIYFGNYALIDLEGNIVFLRQGYLTRAQRDAAPANFRFVNFGDAELDEEVTKPEYAVGPGVRYVYYKHPSGRVKLPPPQKFYGRLITVCNDHESGRITVQDVPEKVSNIPAGGVMTYRSNGKSWRAVTNP